MPYGRGKSDWHCGYLMVSIPHMGCMPYGLGAPQRPPFRRSLFQSLIWVACPTGRRIPSATRSPTVFQSLIWVACPTGLAPLKNVPRKTMFQSLIWVACPTGRPIRGPALRDPWFQSLIWVACPTGLCYAAGRPWSMGFNPSYGLHALRASQYCTICTIDSVRFNPSYGLHALRAT